MKFKFDLKGSTYKREVLVDSNVKDKSKFLEGKILKDNNWKEMNMKIQVEPDIKDRLLNILKEDSLFLQKIKSYGRQRC